MALVSSFGSSLRRRPHPTVPISALAGLPAATAASPVVHHIGGTVPVRWFGLLDRLKAGVAAGFTEKTEAKKRS